MDNQSGAMKVGKLYRCLLYTSIELGDDTGPLAELVACWRASVEATHTFLTPDDTERIAAYVPCLLYTSRCV